MINKYDENFVHEYENGFYLTSEPYRIGKILAHYELYKHIVELPGDVVELGVFKGASLIQWSTFRELLENEKSRSIIGFDAFGEFPDADMVKSDAKFVKEWNEGFRGEFLTDDDIRASLKHKGIKNVELVKGNISDTLPRYVEDNPHLRIALLHLDVDVYEPSKVGLEALFDRVVPGGVICFDDYGVIEGETKAVDEFFLGKKHIFKKFSFSHQRPTYYIKE